jgi:hypothetical protein
MNDKGIHQSKRGQMDGQPLFICGLYLLINKPKLQLQPMVTYVVSVFCLFTHIIDRMKLTNQYSKLLL